MRPTDAAPADARGFDAGPSPDTRASDLGPSPDTRASDAAESGPDADLPRLHLYAPASEAHARALVRRALGGLGFAGDDPSGPQPADRVFVGRHLLGWVDETGFYGKLQGLWRLNGLDGDALDFALTDAGGRPVNFLVPGENGDGRWPAGYPGAEHIEFPNRVPEPDDPPDCASRDWCNQFALNEAADITNPDIPHWSACNRGGPRFSDRFAPVSEQLEADAVELWYEGPLVKEADGDGRADGDDCHADYLFADGVRRRVYLRVGLRFEREATHVDRLMQVRNPAENPPFDGPMSFIGGFVITAWPEPHPQKRIDRWLRPELGDVADPVSGAVLVGGRFTRHDHEPARHDEIFAWLGQPISLSAVDRFVAGRSVTLAHVGEQDNDDVGVCFCRVHGGLELGGGLIHGGISLPVAGGASSAVARRRLTLAGPVEEVEARTYEAERDLLHAIGRADADGWSAATADDPEGHLAYGPYAEDWGGGRATATFRFLVDDNEADDGRVVTLDVYDATAEAILALREVRRREMTAPFAYQDFSLDVELAGREGHWMETRVYWHDISYVRLDRVAVRLEP